MQGLHLTADLHGCRRAQAWLPDAPLLGGACMDAARAAGLQPVGQLFHGFAATAQGLGGVTATVLLVSRHRSSVGLRWPSKRIAALHRLPIRSVWAVRCALRCAPMAARSLRHLIGDATLAQSHLCAHTWPEQRAATLDVHVCNFGADHAGKAQPLREALPALFGPSTVLRHALQRGALP